jgi:predicted O-methyltransferase YrrM
MATAGARLTGRSDRSARALGTALRSTALGAFPPEERAWIERIEAQRRRLPSDAVAVSRERPDDRRLSAGEHLGEAAAACEWMSVPPASSRFMLRLVRELAPRSCLELGTGFGISTAYQAAALDLNEAGRIVSLDVAGMTEIAAPALGRLGLADRVELIPGRIEETLAGASEGAAPIDYVLLDADHTEEGTLRPFGALLPLLSDGAVVVIDDINWTDEMRRAWARAREHPAVRMAVGVHRLGVAIAGAAA